MKFLVKGTGFSLFLSPHCPPCLVLVVGMKILKGFKGLGTEA
jgi:hypothetical protein